MLLQVGILYVIWVCVLCRYFPILRSTRYFYFMTISLLCFITLPILYVILDQNPIIWMLSFVFNTRKRVSLTEGNVSSCKSLYFWSSYFRLLQIVVVIYWAICLLSSVFILAYQILANSQATSSIRKIFHVLATFVYVPGVIYDPSLLYLASGLILALFIAIEVI